LVLEIVHCIVIKKNGARRGFDVPIGGGTTIKGEKNTLIVSALAGGTKK